MSQTTLITVTGAVLATPATGSGLTGTIPVNVQRACAQKAVGAPSINSTDGSPFVLPFQSVTKARFLYLKVNSGSVKVLVTSPAGAAQVFRCSGTLILDSPAEGDQLTAINLVGTADIEYLLAGD